MAPSHKITKDEKQIIVNALKAYSRLLDIIIKMDKTILVDEVKLELKVTRSLISRLLNGVH